MERYFTPSKRSFFRGKGWNIFFASAQFFCIIFAVYWLFEKNLPSPGWAVAVMGFVAAVMSVHAEMKDWQKGLWLLILTALLYTELRSIRKDRLESHEQYLKDRKAQDDAFSAVLKAQNAEFSATVEGFSTTQGKVEGVLKTTQQVAAISNENLLNVTGGDSFACVYPDIIQGQSEYFLLKIHNYGNQTLTGVIVTIQRAVHGKFGPTLTEDIEAEAREPVQVGNVFGGEGRILPSPARVLVPKLNTDGTAQYHFIISSQAQGLSETIDFRPAKSERNSAYKLTAWRVIEPNKKRSTDFRRNNKWIRIVKETDWIEPHSIEQGIATP